jgi:maltose phosphorylase
MAGSWLAIVEGFGGMRVLDDKLHLNPLIPEQWKSYSFNARFRGILFEVKVTGKEVLIRNLSENLLQLSVYKKDYEIEGLGKISIKV